MDQPVTFRLVTVTAMVACDLCASVVDNSERGRAMHQQWHADLEAGARSAG